MEESVNRGWSDEALVWGRGHVARLPRSAGQNKAPGLVDCCDPFLGNILTSSISSISSSFATANAQTTPGCV